MCFNNTAFAASETEESAEDTKVEKDSLLEPAATDFTETPEFYSQEKQSSEDEKLEPKKSFLSKIKLLLLRFRTKIYHLGAFVYEKLRAVKVTFSTKLYAIGSIVREKIIAIGSTIREKIIGYKHKWAYDESKGSFSTQAQAYGPATVIKAVKTELNFWLKIFAVMAVFYIFIMGALHRSYVKQRNSVREKVLAELRTEKKEVLDRLQNYQYITGAREILNTPVTDYRYYNAAGNIPDPELAIRVILLSETNTKRRKKYNDLLSELKDAEDLKKVSKKIIIAQVQNVYDVTTQWYLSWLKQTAAYKALAVAEDPFTNYKTQQKLPFFEFYVRLNLFLKKYGIKVRKTAYIKQRLSLAEKLRVLNRRRTPLKLKLLDQFINEHADADSVKDNPLLIGSKTFLSGAIASVNAELDHAIN